MARKIVDLPASLLADRILTPAPSPSMEVFVPNRPTPSTVTLVSFMATRCRWFVR